MWRFAKREDFEARVLPELEDLQQSCLCLTGDDSAAQRLFLETINCTYRNWTALRRESTGRVPLFSVLTEQYLKQMPTGSRLLFFCPAGACDQYLVEDLFASMKSITWPHVTPIATVAKADAIRAVYCLPPASRLATVLALVNRLSYAEISASIGVSKLTVRAWLCQGRRQLQRAFLTIASDRGDQDWSEGNASAGGDRNFAESSVQREG